LPPPLPSSLWRFRGPASFVRIHSRACLKAMRFERTTLSRTRVRPFLVSLHRGQTPEYGKRRRVAGELPHTDPPHRRFILGINALSYRAGADLARLSTRVHTFTHVFRRESSSPAPTWRGGSKCGRCEDRRSVAPPLVAGGSPRSRFSSGPGTRTARSRHPPLASHRLPRLLFENKTRCRT